MTGLRTFLWFLSFASLYHKWGDFCKSFHKGYSDFSSVYMSVHFIGERYKLQRGNFNRTLEFETFGCTEHLYDSIVQKKKTFDLTYGLAFYSKVVHTSFLYVRAHEALTC